VASSSAHLRAYDAGHDVPRCPVETGEDMKRMLVAVASLVCLLAGASSTSAQLLVAKEGPIVYGHHHLNASNIDAQKKFFVDTLGGKAIKIGANNTEVIEFPNVLIFFRPQAPTAGTRGTTVNHIGFSVPNLRQMVTKVKANGYRMITREEVVAGREVKDDIAAPTAPGGASIAFTLGPDDVKVELVESKTQKTARSPAPAVVAHTQPALYLAWR
jgi:catechol 2,3-dioxygenase-like lactoylglutathione lyase family enzyme